MRNSLRLPKRWPRGSKRSRGAMGSMSTRVLLSGFVASHDRRHNPPKSE